MPRNPNNKNEFIAGQLPIIKFKRQEYFVDGRMKIVRNVKNFIDELDVESDVIWNKLKKKTRNIICFEFYGSKPYDV